MLLDVPVILQAESYDCGAAVVDMVCAFHGRRQRGPAALCNAIQGMHPDTIAAYLRALGLVVWAGPILTGVDGLRHLTRAAIPVLCPVSLYGGHWTVVRGVERGRVHFNCPVAGPVVLGRADWLAVWRDTSSESGHAFDRWGIAVAK